MPSLTDVLAPAGALVNVLIGVSAAHVKRLRVAGRPIPAPVSARALLDTGADITCVDGTLVQAADLSDHGTVLANLPAYGGLNPSFLYDASLTIVHPSGNPLHDLVIHDLPVLEVPLAHLPYRVLIGRDVLARCRFLYNGPGNRFRLSY